MRLGWVVVRQRGVAAQPRPVAMGVAPDLAQGACASRWAGTTEADVDRALAVVPEVVAALRQGRRSWRRPDRSAVDRVGHAVDP